MRLIPLTKGQFSIVDDEDFERFGCFKWIASFNRATKSFYAIRSFQVGGVKKQIILHRAILGLTDPKVFGDHKNHDTLDNRKSNLRSVTQQQNNSNKRGPSVKNKCGIRGVSLKEGRWRSHIRVNGKGIHLGTFHKIEDAAAAYAAANKKYFGEFGGPI